MAVKFSSVKCPECKANLEVEVGRERLFCSYCGAQIIVTDENEHTYHHIDDADVKRAETERLIYLKELELEEKSNERSRKGRNVAYIIAVIIAIIGLILFPLTSGMSVAIAFFVSGIIAMSAYDSGENKKKKKGRLLHQNQVQISESMNDYDEKNFNTIVALYRAAGFDNVTAVPLCDLNIFAGKKNGKVETVAIGGNDDFDEGDIFYKSDNITITYHSFK